jgi:hypothetical protein
MRTGLPVILAWVETCPKVKPKHACLLCLKTNTRRSTTSSLSHLHVDHWGEIPYVVTFGANYNRVDPLRVYGPSGRQGPGHRRVGGAHQ